MVRGYTVNECADFDKAVEEVETLLRFLDAYGVSDWVTFDPSVVRGLAYYTGVVFEVFDRRGEFRAICGGGRYDRLISVYGARREVPCVGFGFGDCVIMELLNSLELVPELRRTVTFVVAAFDSRMQLAAMKVADRIRTEGVAVDLFLQPKGRVSQVSFAM